VRNWRFDNDAFTTRRDTVTSDMTNAILSSRRTVSLAAGSGFVEFS
jgi:hypothetical protein